MIRELPRRQSGDCQALIPQWYDGVVAFTVRTDQELEEALTALAKSEGVSRQEVIRRAILERYARSTHVERVADSTEEMQQRWSEVLERLNSK